jgi:hypothetical protein
MEKYSRQVTSTPEAVLNHQKEAWISTVVTRILESGAYEGINSSIVHVQNVNPSCKRKIEILVSSLWT